MKERPILFSGAMVRAILEGRKTQTRRVVKFSKDPDAAALQQGVLQGGFINFNIGSEFMPCPYGMPGDCLWVRETFQLLSLIVGAGNSDYYVYKATDPDWENTEEWRWRPSIFMPRDASRILLAITEVRVERLNDISEADAVQEGVLKGRERYLDYLAEKHQTTQFIYQKDTAKGSYKTLWQLINGHNSWDENPWVWVVEFKRIEAQ